MIRLQSWTPLTYLGERRVRESNRPRARLYGTVIFGFGRRVRTNATMTIRIAMRMTSFIFIQVGPKDAARAGHRRAARTGGGRSISTRQQCRRDRRGLLGGMEIVNPYIADILAQPAALRDALERYSPAALEKIKLTDFDRVLISGMGSSYNAAYPALIRLSNQSKPVQLVNAAELLHSLNGMIGTRSLLWLNSQSGRSAELVHLLERFRPRPPACLLTFVNDLSSPMAERADVCIPVHAGAEATVSAKTYVNMLAVNLLAAIQLGGGDVELAIREMLNAAEAMKTYLVNWEIRVRGLDSMLGDFERLFILGRGSSMSAVWNGSLINKEAAGCAFEGMHAADFRHGPLELVAAGFAAVIFAGSGSTSALNRELALDILSYGGKVIWVDSIPDPEIPTHLLPETSDLTRPLVEILPMQMLTLAMADRKGLEAGKFTHVGKVTDRE